MLRQKKRGMGMINQISPDLSGVSMENPGLRELDPSRAHQVPGLVVSRFLDEWNISSTHDPRGHWNDVRKKSQLCYLEVSAYNSARIMASNGNYGYKWDDSKWPAFFLRMAQPVFVFPSTP